MNFVRIYLISLLLINHVDIPFKDRLYFISPVKIPLALSANFGELRIDHFHSGVDIKTQGVTGQEVVAAADGYIYRIGVAPGGFGKALYVRHPGGYSTVYAHLERFTAEVDAYVKRSQYERKSFTVSLFPEEGRFPVKQGDLIAYSGNSGGSSGPHLHYEIRDSETEKPLNPLLFDFGKDDNIKPVIERLAIYPINANSRINGKNSVLKIPVTGGNGKYTLAKELTISGTTGFGIKSYDLINEAFNKCSAYSVELRIDSNKIYRYIMDGFAFSESRYVNSHIDYETYIKENTYYERMFLLPNNRLSAYKDVKNRGLFNFTDSGYHKVEVIITDAHNNESRLAFTVKSSVPEGSGKRIPEVGAVPMVYNRINRFKAENISVTIPSGALYDTLFFVYRREPGTPEMFSDVHQVHNKFTPLHRPCTIAIRPDSVPAGLESKMLILQVSDNGLKSSLGGAWSEGYLSTETSSFGTFCVGIDTTAPAIYPNGLSTGADLSGKREMRIRITDDLSGIKVYEPSIDGKWALFEYDQKNNVLIYKFDPERITKGTLHTLVLKVTDNRENQSEFICEFRW